MGSNDDGRGGEYLQLGQDSPIARELNHVEILEILLKGVSNLGADKIWRQQRWTTKARMPEVSGHG